MTTTAERLSNYYEFDETTIDFAVALNYKHVTGRISGSSLAGRHHAMVDDIHLNAALVHHALTR